ncbi:MAG: hypothetical protein IJ693_03575 [Bacteroidaceae bacterium]|nr:hypothetical protein [Bacteroidaceae bacterium]
MKQTILWVLAAILTLSGAMSAVAQTSDGAAYTITRISNPDCGERQPDGLVPGGDRENSYAWRMALRGDEIYIATARNIASVLVNMYGARMTSDHLTMDDFWALIDAVDNGDILRNDANEGANIISYNRTTGEFRVVYTAENGIYFRSAVTFGDNVYFGSYSANPDAEQYILRLDSEGEFTKVFTTHGSVSMRANCVYDDHLFFAGVEERELTIEEMLEMLFSGKGTPTYMAVLRKSVDDDTVWERVADYRDFGDLPYDNIMSSWAGSPIWELASHAGYIYATAPSTAGFVIWRGHPAADGEQANDYGWHWEEVAGLNNGINNPGLSSVAGGEPSTMRSLIGSVFEYQGRLYAYNFDHSFGGEAAAFAGIMQKLGGQNVKANDYLEYIYNTLHNPQKIWRLDDETGRFEECTEFTRLMEGTTNEYVWRMGEYDGQLYIATMDAGIFYGYLTQLTNGSLINMSAEELQTKVQYIANAISILARVKANNTKDELQTKLETLKGLLAILQPGDGESEAELAEKIGTLVETAKLLIQAKLDAMDGETLLDKLLIEALTKAKEHIEDLADRIDVEGVKKYLYINNIVKNSEWGFDLYRTTDGETFETITTSGMGDKYNYGCPSFLATDEGLYFGTCNPFYGAQLYLLTNNQHASKVVTSIDSLAARRDLDNCYYTTSGQKFNHRPTAKGIYIHGGKKVVIK